LFKNIEFKTDQYIIIKIHVAIGTDQKGNEEHDCDADDGDENKGSRKNNKEQE
jgi:hypothetical protein